MLPLSRPEERPAAGPEVWIRRLKANESVTVAICSPRPWRFFLHWAGDKSEPHFQDRSRCPGCRRKLPLKYKSYLYVVNANKRDCEFLELTSSSEEAIERMMREGQTWRGFRMTVVRGKGDKARLVITPHPRWEDVSDRILPEDKDPAITLCRLWGIEDLPDSELAKPTLPFAKEA